MKDDPKSNIQFVKFVEKFPVLYDVRFDGYSRKEFQDKAWNNVATAMKDSVPNCKEKWRNIRTCLTRHLRQAKDRQKNPEKMRRPYYLAPYMNFLIPFTKTRLLPQQLSVTNDNNVDPLRDDSDPVPMSDDDVDCLKPRIVDVKGDATYEEMSYAHEARRAACLKEEEAITEEEDEDVLEVAEEDAIEVVEEDEDLEEEREKEEEGRKAEEEAGRKKATEAGDEPKRRRKSEEAKGGGVEVDAREEMLRAASGGLNTIRINHFDGKNARISVERSPSPTNADLDFFKSLLPEVSGMTRSQKSRFRMSVLKSLHELLYGARIDS